MITKKLDHFNLQQIAQSGQCFRWKEIGNNEFETVAFGYYLRMKQEGDSISFSAREEEWDSIWASYFDLQGDYANIERLVRDYNETHLTEAYECGSGIRILNQNLWEIIVSFLISQNNNIRRISNSIEEICRRCALPCSNDTNHFRFPLPGEIDPNMFDDSTLGLGYRNTYLKEIYIYAAEHPDWLEGLKTMSFDEAFSELTQRKGIGPKVANCICLFGLHMTDAFPIDTHVKALLKKYYPNGLDITAFKGNAGVIQQYLFYYELKH